MSLRRFVVLTPFQQPEVVAGILRLRELAAQVIGTDSGVCVVHEVAKPEFTDWDIAELLGDAPQELAAEELMTQTISPVRSRLCPHTASCS